MKIKNLFLTLLAVVVVTFALAGCDKKSQPIKIGYASPTSGNQAETGIDQMRGAQLTIEKLNASGGILGKKVELVAFDDRADPKEANTPEVPPL